MLCMTSLLPPMFSNCWFLQKPFLTDYLTVPSHVEHARSLHLQGNLPRTTCIYDTRKSSAAFSKEDRVLRARRSRVQGIEGACSRKHRGRTCLAVPDDLSNGGQEKSEDDVRFYGVDEAAQDRILRIQEEYLAAAGLDRQPLPESGQQKASLEGEVPAEDSPKASWMGIDFRKGGNVLACVNGTNQAPALVLAWSRWQVPWGMIRSVAVIAALKLSSKLVEEEFGALVEEGLKLALGPNGVLLARAVVPIASIAAALLIYVKLLKGSRPLPSDVFLMEVSSPRHEQYGWLRAVKQGCIVWCILLLISLLGFGSAETLSSSLFIEEMGKSGTNVLWTLLTYIWSFCICRPLLEELALRGFLMPALTKWIPTPLAIGVSALVYALWHFHSLENFWQRDVTVGLVLGALYSRTRNLAVPVILHGLWNLFGMLFLIIRAVLIIGLQRLTMQAAPT